VVRLSTWNCCRGKPEVKLPHLLSLKPDVAAVQECARPLSAAPGRQEWHGDNPRQGLLAYAGRGFRVRSGNRRRIAARHYVPVRVTGAARFNLLMVWVKPYRRPGRYMDSLLRGIKAYEGFIRSGPTVVLGDFNSAACFGPAHHGLIAMLSAEFDLVSAYHEYYGLAHGDEAHATYFDRTQQGRPYHLDYCFVPRAWRVRIEAVAVGRPEDWGRLSDHVPITVELGRSRARPPALHASVR
jgi:hypothetical protein